MEEALEGGEVDDGELQDEGDGEGDEEEGEKDSEEDKEGDE